MLNKLFTKMLITYISIIAIIVGVLALSLTHFFTHYYYQSKLEHLHKQGDEISQLFEGFAQGKIGRIELDRAVNVLAEVSNTRIFLLNGDQQLIVKTLNLNLNENHGNQDFLRQGVKQILQGETIERKRQFSNTLNTEVVFVGKPLLNGDKIEGVLLLFAPLSETVVTLRNIYKIIWLTALVTMFLAGIIIYIVSKRMSTPIITMSNAFVSLAEGKSQPYITVDSQDEIGRLANAFNYMKDQLGKTESIRRELIASVSHELRTPLTSIRGFIQGILDGVITTEQQAKYLQISLSEIERMTGLINDMLDLAKMQSGFTKLYKERVELVNLLKQIIDGYSPIAQEKQIKLLFECLKDEIYIECDRDKCKQIFGNLIINSLKYTKAGGLITVSVSDEQNRVSISVKDNGIGIPKDQLPYIFDKFHRVDKSREADTGGSGLGLSIVKNLVELHGGHIEAKSELGQGSEFIITL